MSERRELNFTIKADPQKVKAWWAQEGPKCSACGSIDPHVTIGWPVCPNDDFHEENTPPLSVWRRIARWFGANR